MTAFDELETDLDNAYDDTDGIGETWYTDGGDGASFTAIFTEFGSDEEMMASHQRNLITGELRWPSADMATVDDDELLYRNREGTTWRVMGAPQDDGFGEIIAQIQRVKRTRHGAN
jgi:hypothetical protein